MKRSKNNLLQELYKQVNFINTSCKSFDEGSEDEALRIAVVLRVLFHDTTQSHSLLEQLGYKKLLKFLDSALAIDPQPTSKKHEGRTVFVAQGLPGLVGITVTKCGGKFIAPLKLRKDAKGYVPFNQWWEDKSIPGHGKNRYSRKSLILQMANKEGGAHIDKEIDETYRIFIRSSLGMIVKVNNLETGFINSAADASIRQIAWELLETLYANNMVGHMVKVDNK